MVVESKPAPTKVKKASTLDRVVNVLKQTNTPLPFSDLRKACHVRTERRVYNDDVVRLDGLTAQTVDHAAEAFAIAVVYHGDYRDRRNDHCAFLRTVEEMPWV